MHTFLVVCIFFCIFALAFGNKVAKNDASRHGGDLYLRSFRELTKLSEGINC